MQIVFVNRLERSAGAGEPERGQVFIGEDQGAWTAGWRLSEEWDAASHDVWYEGVSWEELLAAFRHGVARKLREGFRPMLDGMLDETPFWERRLPLPAVLQCYAEGRVNEEAAEKLRQWRRARSVREGRSPFLIATNRELQLLAAYLPHTAEELLQIPGFGRMKTERYGAELTGLLRSFPRGHSFPLDWVAGQTGADELTDWLFRQKEARYEKALATIRDKRRLLAGIRAGLTLEQLEGELQCPRRMLLERIEKLDEEGYDVLPLIEKELTLVPEDELGQVEAALQELGDRYLKPIHRKVYGEKSAGPEAERHYETLRLARIRYRRQENAS